MAVLNFVYRDTEQYFTNTQQSEPAADLIHEMLFSDECKYERESFNVCILCGAVTAHLDDKV